MGLAADWSGGKRLGYCHYWGRPAELSLSGFGTFAQECVRRCRALGVPWLGLLGGVKIGNAFGQGRPMFRQGVISFDGRPSDEPLSIHRLFHKPQQEPDGFNLYWDFVKSGGRAGVLRDAFCRRGPLLRQAVEDPLWMT